MSAEADQDEGDGQHEEDHGVGALVIQEKFGHNAIPRDNETCRTWKGGRWQ